MRAFAILLVWLGYGAGVVLAYSQLNVEDAFPIAAVGMIAAGVASLFIGTNREPPVSSLPLKGVFVYALALNGAVLMQLRLPVPVLRQG